MKKIFVIKNGLVFNSENKSFDNQDIYIHKGRIFSKSDVKNTDYLLEWDAKGKYVSPGFIDIHTHVFENYAKLSINADKIGVEQGVTTVIDAGSTGLEDFNLFKENIINKSVTDVFSLLNISKRGLIDNEGELSSLNRLMGEDEWEAIKAKEPSIVGLKARMSQSVVGEQGILPLKHGKKLAKKANVPIMVHIGSPPPKLSDIFPLLDEGDIITHAFHGKKGGILGKDNFLIPEVKKALERGVKLDVGHGRSSFSFNTIEKFKQKYTFPFTVSTDIYEENFIYPVKSLMTTIDKLLAVGYDIKDLLHAVTFLPAKNLALKKRGTLDIGNIADITVFDIVDSEEKLVDSNGDERMHLKSLVPYATWKAGEIVYKSF